MEELLKRTVISLENELKTATTARDLWHRRAAELHSENMKMRTALEKLQWEVSKALDVSLAE